MTLRLMIRRRPALIVAFAIVYGAALASTRAPQPDRRAARWFKGNTHTHTLNSDGDSTPDEVVRWYREHGYQFLVLTDHNYLTSVDGLNALHGASDRFLAIRGEEVTERFGAKAIHVNGLDLRETVTPQGGTTVVDVLQRDVDAIRAAGGIPHINHPNFLWSITADELKQVRNTRLFEVFNGHPRVNNDGGGGVPGMDEVWDVILSSGSLLYGIAVDDAHTFKQPWDPLAPRPGRGWVVVRAERLEAALLLQALERGEFYASTGVELAEYDASPAAITVKVKEDGFSKYRIRFSGRSGRLLKEEAAASATYRPDGSEGYVRAKIFDSNGKVAWTQPIVMR